MLKVAIFMPSPDFCRLRRLVRLRRPRQRGDAMFRLWQGERIGFAILAVLGAVLALQHQRGQAEVVWAAFVDGFVFYGLIMSAGLGLRLAGRLPRLSLTLVALGFYPIYASLLALVGYMQFPLSRPTIDPLLLRIDAAFGYDWAAGVAWLARHPELSRLLAAVYLSALPQLALLLLVLGALGRVAALHRMLVTGMIAGIVMMAFWSLWPSFGPSVLVPLDPAAAARSGVLVTNAYGAELLRLASEGIGRIEKHQLLGTVAFPSFHMFMALLAAWFARGTWLFWPYLLLNSLMIPATALHGGHHAVDLVGGGLLFAGAHAAACRLVPADQVITSGAVRPVRAAIPASASTAAATPASAAWVSPVSAPAASRSR
jgi:hypothetical protein